MHWLKYVRLNRKDRLKNMLADLSGVYSVISSAYQCVTGPL